ncbi:MAG: ATP-binding protein [Myxococcota bacterium]
MTIRDRISFDPNDHLGSVFIAAGLIHPAWWLLGPRGPGDPLALWVAVGGGFVVAGAIARFSARVRRSGWHFAASMLATAHLYGLFLVHPGEAYYAAAAFMIALSTLLVIRAPRVFRVYSAFVAVACVTPLVVHGGGMAAFYCAGTLSVLLFANRSFAIQRANERRAASALREAHSELERLERELEVSQRMDSLGRLAGAFSHEFNNQLMAIRIHADLLERSLPKSAAQRGDVEQIQRTTSAAADLTARLLAFSRPPRQREEPAEACAVVEQNLVTLQHVMSAKIPVTWSPPSAPVHVPVGGKQLSQLLLNLALNARDAMPDGGTLHIAVASMPRHAVELPIEIPTETLVVLTVRDTGAGMTAAVRDRLFEPFFTTKADRGNSGLGLSVVYGIVKESGGHVRVTSEPGQGARFDIYWPEVDGASRSAQTARALEAPTPHRARVLLVEDQAALRDGLARWLGDQGFAVISCESGEEALARARDVDVIASDVVLRGMDGIELLRRLRGAAPKLPAVLFSGYLDHLATKRREIPDGVMFLEKPFAPEALLSTLDGLIAHARGARAAVPTR